MIFFLDHMFLAQKQIWNKNLIGNLYKDRLCIAELLTSLRRASIMFFTVTTRETATNLISLSYTSKVLNFLFYFFYLRYQKQFSFHQSVEKVSFYTNDGRSFPVGTIVNKLTLTNKIMSIDRGDQKQFVLLTLLLCLYVPNFCLRQFHFF